MIAVFNKQSATVPSMGGWAGFFLRAGGGGGGRREREERIIHGKKRFF